MRRSVTDFEIQDVESSNAAGSGGEPATPTIHLTLQGKGGVGKSLVASILAQYFRHRGAEIHCVDTDPVNQTFSQYAELGAEHLELMHDGKIDSRGFDVLMERFSRKTGFSSWTTARLPSFRSGATSWRTTYWNCSTPPAEDCAFTRW